MTTFFNDKVVSIVRLLKTIIPFVLIVIFCAGVVKGGYLLLEHYLLQPPVVQTVMEEEIKRSGSDAEQPLSATERDYTIILERNLFGSLPEQAVEETANDPKYTEDIELTSLDIILLGTVQGNEGSNRAIIHDKATNKQDLYKKGDRIQSALIEKILRGKVILSFNGRDQMLDMSGSREMRAGGPLPGPAGKARSQADLLQKSPVAVAPNRTPRRVVGGTAENAVRPRVIRPSRRIRTE